MKKIYALITITAAMLMFSCSKDDLKGPREPSIYANAEALEADLRRLHQTGAPAFYGETSPDGGPIAAAGGYLSGFFESEASGASTLYDNCRQLTFDASNISPYLDHLWSRSYEAIEIANNILNYAPQSPGVKEELRRVYMAEARLLRAFNYFYLARAFGEVPLVLNNRPEEKRQPAELSEIYRLIVEDLQQAIAHLCSEVASPGVRIGRTAAQMLLADVYLTLSGYPLCDDHYREAARMALRVIESGKHTLAIHGSAPESSAYNLLRTQSTCTEYIYGYQPSGIERSLSALCLSKKADQWGVLTRSTHDGYKPSREFLRLYDPVEDLRAQEQQFFHSFLVYQQQEVTVIQTFTPSPYFWFDREAMLGTGSSHSGAVPIYRYAETLLIAAEAIARSEGVTPKAVECLTAVRSRALHQVESSVIAEELSGLGAAEFVEEVWKERLREFPLEMKLWADIQRTRKYPVTTPGGTHEIAFVDLIGATSRSGAVFAEQHLLLPRPVK